MLELLHDFYGDLRVQALLLLVALDFLLGVSAAAKTGTFRLSYVADFARRDLLGKVIPFLILYGALTVGGEAVEISGTALDVLTWSAYGVIVAAMGGSIFSSLRDLGLLAGESKVAAAVTAPESKPV